MILALVKMILMSLGRWLNKPPKTTSAHNGRFLLLIYIRKSVILQKSKIILHCRSEYGTLQAQDNKNIRPNILYK